jgi:hypothetical protein
VTGPTRRRLGRVAESCVSLTGKEAKVRLLIVELALLALASAAGPAAAEPEGGWIVDAKGCKIANPNPKPNETVKWSGACKDGFAEGKGVLEYAIGGKPGARYEGQLKRGRFDGRGVLRTTDGAVYDGDWVDGAQDGYGEYTAPDKSTFKGGWTAGKPDGPGVLTTPDGKVVKGVWANGKYLTPYPDAPSGISRPAEPDGGLKKRVDEGEPAANKGVDQGDSKRKD